MGQTIPTFSAKEALKAVGIVSTILDQSNADHGVAVRVISQSQRGLWKNGIEEYSQTNIKSYFTK